MHCIHYLIQQLPKDITLVVLKKSRPGPCDVCIRRNLKWDQSQPGSPLICFHSTSNQLVLSVPVSHVRLGFLAEWHLGMLT